MTLSGTIQGLRVGGVTHVIRGMKMKPLAGCVRPGGRAVDKDNCIPRVR